MNTKQKLDKRIRELVPSLMELSKGCEVEFFGRTLGTIIEKVNDESIYCDVGSNILKKITTKGIYKIIGHPIQLQHILLAIEKVNNDEKYVISSTGVFGHIDDVDHGEPVKYNLSKSYNDQEEEVHKFLAEILNA